MLRRSTCLTGKSAAPTPIDAERQAHKKRENKFKKGASDLESVAREHQLTPSDGQKASECCGWVSSANTVEPGFFFFLITNIFALQRNKPLSSLLYLPLQDASSAA